MYIAIRPNFYCIKKKRETKFYSLFIIRAYTFPPYLSHSIFFVGFPFSMNIVNIYFVPHVYIQFRYFFFFYIFSFLSSFVFHSLLFALLPHVLARASLSFSSIIKKDRHRFFRFSLLFYFVHYYISSVVASALHLLSRSRSLSLLLLNVEWIEKL